MEYNIIMKSNLRGKIKTGEYKPEEEKQSEQKSINSHSKTIQISNEKQDPRIMKKLTRKNIQDNSNIRKSFTTIKNSVKTTKSTVYQSK